MRKLTREIFIEEAIKIHGDKYDYSKVVYIDIDTKVCIICPEHGEFWQSPYSHIRKGHGCQKCANKKIGEKRTHSREFIINQLSYAHNNFYDYSKFNYVNDKTKGEIICPVHGSFWQTPNNHKKGHGCSKCGNDKRVLDKREENINKFLKEANLKHNNIYEYKDIDKHYVNANTKIPIICKKHGEFWQEPSSHKSGSGCPKCDIKVSKPEIEVGNFVRDMGFEIKCNLRNIIPPLELDIFIPSLNKAIEFNGDWWHYNKNNPHCKPDGYHENKTQKCKDIGIELLHIKESDWKNRRSYIEDQILKLLKIK